MATARIKREDTGKFQAKGPGGGRLTAISGTQLYKENVFIPTLVKEEENYG
jgi:hypothetical protein